MIRELFPDVFAVENEEGGSNVGIIVGKNSLLIVDSTLFPSKFQQILDFCATLTHKPLIGVFLTHYHPDHSFGVMGHAEIEKLTSEKTQKILENLPKEYLNDIKSRLGESGKELDRLEFRLLRRIKDGATVDLGMRKVRFMNLGGHTPDLTAAYVEDAGVLFASDLMITTVHAEIVEDSDMNAWMKAIEQLSKLRIEYIVPGHGTVAEGKKTLNFTRDYLKLAASVIESLKNNKDMEYLDLPSEFQHLRFPELLVEGVVRKLR